MRLKEIEISGFKSFADRTRIILDKDLTIVVGPNGSGKSNIADAVLWAIGEQSPKNLRGSKMADVIFHGNKKRPPAGSAEVFIYFENDDKEKVKIGRRLLKSGESYYLIDDSVVRLKDIHEFCYKNNISVHGSFLVEQGKVEAILAMSPEDRRTLFEEVSAISHYKENRKSAESKLQSTQNNLLRLNDIIVEVETELQGLKKQAQKADRYLKLAEEEKIKKRKFFGRTMFTIRTRESHLKSELDLYYDERTKRSSNLAKIEASLHSTKLKKSEEESNNLTITEELHQLEISKERLEQDNKRKFDQIVSAKDRLREISEDLTTLETKLKEKNRFLISIGERKKVFEEEKGKIASDLAKQSNEIEIVGKKLGDIEANLLRKQKENLTLAEERSSKKSLFHQIEEEMKKLVERENRHNRESERLKRERETAEENLFDEEASLLQKSNQLKEKEEELQKVANQSEILKKKIDNYSLEIVNLEKTIAGENSKLKVLQNQENLLKSKTEIEFEKKYENLKDKRISNILKDVPEGTLKVLELFLGGYVSSYRIEKVEELREILNENKGKVKERLFFLLDEISLNRVNLKIDPKFKSFKGMASQMEGIGDVLKRHIKDVPRFSDFDDALQFVKENHYPALTLDDSLLINEDGFLILGPLSELSIPLIKITKEIEETKRKSEKLKKDASGLEDEKKSLFEQEKKLKEMESELYKEKVELEKEVQEGKLSLQRAESELKRISAYEDLQKLEYKEIERNKEELEKEKGSLKERLSKIEKEILKIEGEISFFEGEKKKLEEELKKCQEIFTEQRLKEKEWQEREKSLLNEESNLTSSIKEIESSKERLIQDQEMLSSRVKKLEKNIVEDETTLSEVLLKITESREKKSNYDATIKFLEEEIAKIEKLEKEAQADLNEIEKEINEREKNLAITESEEKGILERFSQDFEEEVSTIADEFKDEPLLSDEEKNKLLEEIVKIQKRKDDLAPLNLLAKEEYESKSSRLKFLTEQKEDLEKAMEDLITTIRKINDSIKSRFLEAFDAINNNFSELFKIVFDGGEGYLSLEDKENPLESGIEIFAQPQGKKVVHNIQLSGGEKALVALTLLFAILSYKPQVFFLLDEIDAPLDDANIEKVLSKLLKEFSNITQFIVISHNKRTMELGNVIYGVTMQESGVSKIFSINLREVAAKN